MFGYDRGTIEALVNYVAEKLLYILVADVAGIIFGSFIAVVTRRKD